MTQSTDYLTEGPVLKSFPTSSYVLPLFTGTLFLSAMLLFSIQPYFSKLVLPRLGGSPGVWSVAMVFFQSVLLLGYAYAHLLTRCFSTLQAIAIHALVLVAAFAFLPLGIADGWHSAPAQHQEFWLLGLFGISIGLPFFAVAANAPLLQAWFSRTGHEHAADPYFLYGASNVGSFASLYLYILVLEPALALGTQSWLWTAGYGLLVLAILWCAAAVLQKPRPAMEAQRAIADDDTAQTSDQAIPARQILVYLGLAAVPSALTIAVTAHITVDVASAPFMWVVPLSLFLLTFVLTFRSRSLIPLSALTAILPWTAIAAAAVILLPTLLPLWVELSVNLLAFFIAVLYCHARLYQLRPPASQLTAFYLWMSVGGVIGGIFAGILSPNIFDSVTEYPLLMLIVLFLLPFRHGMTAAKLVTSAAFAAAVGGLLWMATWLKIVPDIWNHASVALTIIGLVTLSAIVRLKSQAAACKLLFLTVPFFLFLRFDQDIVHMERSFFGVIKVKDTVDSSHRRMVHGTTVHGSISMDAFGPEPGTGRPEPLAYYHVTGEMMDTLTAARAVTGGPLGRAAVVGLGTGSLLCHRDPAEIWTVYEIDQAVIDVASNPAYFRFVSDCAPDTKMVLGDARLTLESEPDGQLDYLLIDAFSSDSIPVHLMTREAIALFFSKLSDNGLLALHISNRYLELASVLAAIADQDGYVIRYAQFDKSKADTKPDQVFGANVAVLARHEADFGPLLANPRWKEVAAGDTTAWTDDYSNIIGAILRKDAGH